MNIRFISFIMILGLATPSFAADRTSEKTYANSVPAYDPAALNQMEATKADVIAVSASSIVPVSTTPTPIKPVSPTPTPIVAPNPVPTPNPDTDFAQGGAVETWFENAQGERIEFVGAGGDAPQTPPEGMFRVEVERTTDPATGRTTALTIDRYDHQLIKVNHQSYQMSAGQTGIRMTITVNGQQETHWVTSTSSMQRSSTQPPRDGQRMAFNYTRYTDAGAIQYQVTHSNYVYVNGQVDQYDVLIYDGSQNPPTSTSRTYRRGDAGFDY